MGGAPLEQGELQPALRRWNPARSPRDLHSAELESSQGRTPGGSHNLSGDLLRPGYGRPASRGVGGGGRQWGMADAHSADVRRLGAGARSAGAFLGVPAVV